MAGRRKKNPASILPPPPDVQMPMAEVICLVTLAPSAQPRLLEDLSHSINQPAAPPGRGRVCFGLLDPQKKKAPLAYGVRFYNTYIVRLMAHITFPRIPPPAGAFR